MSTADGPIDTFTLGMMLVAAGLVLMGLFCIFYLLHEHHQRKQERAEMPVRMNSHRRFYRARRR